jgi:hypothetical protein
MNLLSYTFFYLVATLLVFQGTHAFGEPSDPMGVVPAEVTQEAGKARLRGGVLATYGYLSLLTALLSHAYPGLQAPLPGMMAVGLGLMAAYGLYVIFFNRKVEYLGVSSTPTNPHHH